MTNPNLSHESNISFADGAPVPSERLVDIVRSLVGDRLILSFSGKDSLAMWLFLRDHNFEVIPYFCYTVPGLSFDDEMIAYYEQFFGQTIYRIPHPYFYSMLEAGALQDPDTRRILASMRLVKFDWVDIENSIAQQHSLGSGGQYFSAVGIRSADNLMRRRLVDQMGPLGFKKRRYYWAIWDWKISDVKEKIRKSGAKISRRYSIWGSTGDSVDYNFIRLLKNQYPEDYRRVLEFFPLVDIEIFRYEQVK